MKNKKQNHTPGTWKVERHEGKTEIWSANHFVATAHHELFFSAEKYNYEPANAHLIAAAPEMLKALEIVVQNLEALQGEFIKHGAFDNKLNFWSYKACIDASKEAIAIARGEK